MSDIILHNYPQSPVAEKVRIAFGMKGFDWRSVEIPRLAPKPMLTKLTGGYRRTPVMQIGADLFCDTQCILAELERRFPEPSFYPTRDAGLMRGMGRWTDGALFDLAVKIILGSAGDGLPADFAQDRGRLYLGTDWAAGLKEANATLPHLAAQMRTTMRWLDDQLSDGRTYLLGDAPGAVDAQFYHLVWFLRGRWSHGPAFLGEFPHLEKWEQAVAAIGHGDVSAMSPEEAIAVAAQAAPDAIDHADDADPQALVAGAAVIVAPDLDGGEQPVEGALVAADAERVVLRRTDPDAGELNVHFPRFGYRVTIPDPA